MFLVYIVIKSFSYNNKMMEKIPITALFIYLKILFLYSIQLDTSQKGQIKILPTCNREEGGSFLRICESFGVAPSVLG